MLYHVYIRQLHDNWVPKIEFFSDFSFHKGDAVKIEAMVYNVENVIVRIDGKIDLMVF